MSIVYEKSTATFNGFISIEEADQLLAWAHAYPNGKLDFEHCEHLHTATLQVLMAAASLNVLSWPSDAPFAAWLKGSFNAIG
ncbi:hypothetical protein PS664_01997 [Pseudomonas fluorescens]|nr:hypothetical protein PS664_01997 [Pseudomonas fluorescens]